MDKIISTKEINRYLKNGIVTPEILGYAAYSVNKRAKNWRDKESEYRDIRRHNRYWYDKYDNEGKAREKKEEYYGYKERICQMFKPTKVHSLTLWRWNRDLQENLPIEKYFLYYEFGGFSFHQPIDGDVETFKLPVEELYDDFGTYGADINELMSMQMVNKIMNGIKKGEYQLQAA